MEPVDWASYWRSPADPVEAMHAHFERHVYHRHSHDSYSFGVTETGAQAFTCRGAAQTSAAGMVMTFNPDDPHDGHAATEGGFSYKMVHIGPSIIADVLGGDAGLPLFAEPVRHDPVLAAALHRLHDALRTGEPLRTDEAIADTVRALIRRGSTRGRSTGPVRIPTGVARARELLHADYARAITTADLAEVAGCSRFALHRAFTAAYGLAPSDYQRQLRLRAARRLLADGHTAAGAAADTGFADQAHLTRWFVRCYGITPARYRAA
jgi:AraC-like DNA-binding protein